MNEILNNVSRISRCLFWLDNVELKKLSVILNYDYEQLLKDIIDLHSYTNEKVNSDRECIDDD